MKVYVHGNARCQKMRLHSSTLHLAICDFAMRIRHHFQKLHNVFVLEGP